MRNQKNPIRLLLSMFAVVLIISVIVAACKKTGITIPPTQATFLDKTNGVYFVTGPGVVDSIGVGVTSVTATSRTISFTVTSPTGAVSGNQYTLSSGTVTIPANQAIGYIVVKGNFPAYDGTGRQDSLIFTFNDAKTSGVTPSDFNNTFTLLMRGACFEGDVSLPNLGGNYNHTVDDGTSPPYATVVIPGTAIGTTGQITIQNFWNAGFKPLVFSLDWTDPNNRLLTFAPQNTGADGSIFDPMYAGQQVWLYPDPAQTGTFSACHQTFQVNYYIVLQPAGLTPGPEQTILSR
jgi:hypothetical protein